MKQYFTGFFTASCLAACTFLFMGAHYKNTGGKQYFDNIIANSITVVNRDGKGGTIQILNEDAKTVTMFGNGEIVAYNNSGTQTAFLGATKEGNGLLRLDQNGSVMTYNENGKKTVFIGTNGLGTGALKTFNEEVKETTFIGTIDNGYGKLSVNDHDGKVTAYLQDNLKTFNADGIMTGYFGTDEDEDGSAVLFDRYGNRGWSISGKK